MLSIEIFEARNWKWCNILLCLALLYLLLIRIVYAICLAKVISVIALFEEKFNFTDFTETCD